METWEEINNKVVELTATLGLRLAEIYTANPQGYIDHLHVYPSQLYIWPWIYSQVVKMEVPRIEDLPVEEQASIYNEARRICQYKHTRTNIQAFAKFVWTMKHLI